MRLESRFAAFLTAVVWGAVAVFPHPIEASTERGDHGITAAEKLEALEVPEVRWDGVPVSRVVQTLQELARELDPDEEGVPIILSDREGLDPEVTLRLNNLSLCRVLDLVALQVDFHLDVQEDAVILRSDVEPRERLETEIFPVSRQAVIRMIGPIEREDDEEDDPFR